MKAIGIIGEYNPFHNGHLYHINEVKKRFPGDVIVLILGGHFTQRGELSILSKWEKAELALQYGGDLVIELPFSFATQSADLFAHGSIALLDALNVSYLVFGSEENNIEKIKNYAVKQIEDPNYHREVKQLLKQGLNYPTAMAKALSEEGFSNPNDLLGLSYVKEILLQQSNIIPLTIQRTNQYHDQDLKEEISSATSIRLSLKKNKAISKAIPYSERILENRQNWDMEKAFPYLQYKILSDQNLEQYQGVDERLSLQLKKAIKKSQTLEELIQNIKQKQDTYNKIKRMLLHIFIGFTKEEALTMKDPAYLRVLGFSPLGKEYLHIQKKAAKLPIVSRFAGYNDPQLNLEQRVTNLYCLLVDKEELSIREYQQSPLFIQPL